MLVREAWVAIFGETLGESWRIRGGGAVSKEPPGIGGYRADIDALRETHSDRTQTQIRRKFQQFCAARYQQPCRASSKFPVLRMKFIEDIQLLISARCRIAVTWENNPPIVDTAPRLGHEMAFTHRPHYHGWNWMAVVYTVASYCWV